jgi:hypothetical protein
LFGTNIYTLIQATKPTFIFISTDQVNYYLINKSIIKLKI